MKIETGVDKLVHIIKDKKKIEIGEAAKKLGVSKVVVEEWADFLEEEGLISIDYNLSKTFLVERKLTKKEVVTKTKEFHSNKDAFVRKIESSIHKLDKDTKGLTDLKEQFSDLKKEVGKEIEMVKDELVKLEDYEKFKRNVDKRVSQQQEFFKKKMGDFDKMVFSEQKKYVDLLDKINIEKDHLLEERKDLDSLKDYEEKLKKRVVEFSKQIEGLKEIIKKEDQKIDVSENHITKLEKLATNIENTIEKRKGSLDPLVEESKQHKQKINDIKKEVLGKIIDKQNEIDVKVGSYNKVITRFKKLFDKKNKIENMIKEVESERNNMKKDLNDLIKKAVAFNLISKSTDVKKHIRELEKRFNEIDKKKKSLKSKLFKLVCIVSGKI